MIQINCNAQNADGTVPCYVLGDNGHQYPAIVENPSRVVFRTTEQPAPTGGAAIWIAGKEFCRFVWPIGTPDWINEASLLDIPTLTYVMVSSTPSLGIDHGARRIIDTQTGARCPLLFNSDFRLFPIYRAGGDLEALLAERKEIGSKGVRWFATCHNLFQLGAHDYSDDELRAFMQWLSDHGWTQAVVANTDVQHLGHDPQWQLDRVCALASSIDGVIVQAVNEWQQNGVNPSNLHKPTTTAIVTHGSSTGDTLGPLPGWDLADFHHRRDGKWPVTVPQTAYENAQPLGNVPEWGDEPIGIGNDGRGDRTLDAGRLHKMGIDMGMWMAGGCAHILAGLQSTPMQEEQAGPARAFLDGVRKGAAL